MTQTKTIIISTGEILVVDVPKDVIFELIEQSWIRYYKDDFSICGNIDIAEGDWILMGVVSQVTEEQSQLVTHYIERVYGGSYYDFSKINEYGKYGWVGTALESFQSLMQANDIDKLFTNPVILFKPNK